MWAVRTLVAVGLLTTGCAGRAPIALPGAAPGEAAAAMERADGLVRHGCYACLKEARDEYARLTAGPLADDGRIRLFETELLIVLREKELALPFDGSMERAREASRALPPIFDVPRILAAVDAVPPIEEGTGRLHQQELRRAATPFIGRSAAELAWLESSNLQPHVRSYVALSLRCARLAGGQDTGETVGPPDEPVLLLFRRQTCRGVRNVSILEGLRTAELPFPEASYFLGRAASATLRTYADRLKLRTYLGEAVDAFSASPAVVYLAGAGHHLLGSCTDALPFYDRTIAIEQRHESAWLGRTMCLSVMGRADEAIESATALIALGSEHLRDGFYWRAFNRHRASNLPLARADIEESKQRGSTPEALTLAGMIEHDQDDLEVAVRDLEGALGMSPRACTAAWYLGLVRIKGRAWIEAARAFENAMSCYELTARDAEDGLAELDRTEDLDPQYRAQQAGNFRLVIANDHRQARAAAANAANFFVNAREMEKVEALLAKADQEPSLVEAVATIRAYIKEHDLLPVVPTDSPRQ